tara:strand:- start:320 stop:820 length:501 start_codon:yes stop_codon:yes gene_type:complete
MKGKRTIKRRRRQGKTDYKARLKLLGSSLPRIVVRKTNNYVIAQYIESEDAKDKVIVGATTKDLLESGWPKEAKGSLKSIPACYLTGIILGKRIQEKLKEKTQETILDLGLNRSIKKSRIYAVLKGLIDSGIKVKHKGDLFPDEKRLKGEHLKNKINFEEIKNKIQ